MPAIVENRLKCSFEFLLKDAQKLHLLRGSISPRSKKRNNEFLHRVCCGRTCSTGRCYSPQVLNYADSVLRFSFIS